MMSYFVIKSWHRSPNLTDHMAVEGNEKDKRNEEDDDSHPTEVCLAPDRCPALEVTDTFWLEGAVKLWMPGLHGEGEDTGEGGDQGDEPGGSD